MKNKIWSEMLTGSRWACLKCSWTSPCWGLFLMVTNLDQLPHQVPDVVPKASLGCSTFAVLLFPHHWEKSMSSKHPGCCCRWKGRGCCADLMWKSGWPLLRGAYLVSNYSFQRRAAQSAPPPQNQATCLHDLISTVNALAHKTRRRSVVT